MKHGLSSSRRISPEGVDLEAGLGRQTTHSPALIRRMCEGEGSGPGYYGCRACSEMISSWEDDVIVGKSIAPMKFTRPAIVHQRALSDQFGVGTECRVQAIRQAFARAGPSCTYGFRPHRCTSHLTVFELHD